MKFTTEIVSGDCPECNSRTLLVNLTPSIYRCVNCGEDVEQKVNGVIKYLKVDKNTDLTTNGKEV